MKLLIIRCLQSDLLPRVMDTWPKSVDYGLLTHAGQHNLDTRPFAHVHEYHGDGDFSAFWAGELASEIAAVGYDKAVIVKHSPDIKGFDNVLLLLSRLDVPRWAHCGLDGLVKPLSKLQALRALASYGAALGPAAALYAVVRCLV
ncbi:MAG: hypothetical protein ACYTBJ_02435 [Planctomycetota bacterium]|jgi:hypothetical protein